MQEKGLIRIDFNDQRRRKDVQLLFNKKGPTAFLFTWPIEGFEERGWQLKWERATLYKRKANWGKKEEEIKWANSFDTRLTEPFWTIEFSRDYYNRCSEQNKKRCSIRVRKDDCPWRKESVELRPATEPKNWCVLFLSLILFLQCFLVFLYPTPLLHSYLEF